MTFERARRLVLASKTMIVVICAGMIGTALEVRSLASMTQNYVQKSTGSGTGLTDSVMIDTGSAVGVGGSPADVLDVHGVARITGLSGQPNYLRFDNHINSGGQTWRLGETGAVGSGHFDLYDETASMLVMSTSANGLVGINTGNPQDVLDVKGVARVTGIAGAPNYIHFDDTANTGGRLWRVGETGGTAFGQFDIYNETDSTLGLTIVGSSGNVGIGTSSPSYKLQVQGDVHSSGEVSAATIHANYQDVAEWVDSEGDLTSGTVVAVESGSTNKIRRSEGGYETGVAGVVSPRPGLILGTRGPGKVLVAHTGRVLVNVDASNGPIAAGDLLVSGLVPGYAMKSDPVDINGIKLHRPGTILGKALQSLEKGRGQILVLLTLQ